jgi:hypothetical protein
MKLTSLAHYFFGFLSAVMVRVSIVFTVINAIVFIIYELDEDWKISDYAYKDIREFLVGLTLGEALLLVAVSLSIF